MIVGREEEIALLNNLYTATKPHFIAVYGRRRVGKTYLIKSHFEKKIFFTFTGIANSPTTIQLAQFSKEFQIQLNYKSAAPQNWFDAFHLLREAIMKSKLKKKVIFIDEMPWLDTKNARFVQAIESFWNGWASTRNDIMLIVCGSAASWMLNKLIKNRGGLHNRVTVQMQIQPFTLKETFSFLKYQGAKYNKEQTMLLYMALGGIPYYLELIDVTKSADQNINDLCFRGNSKLKQEFSQLFASLFQNEHRHIAIIQALAKRRKGLQRTELIKAAKLGTGGTTTAILEELIAASFLRKYIAFGKTEKDATYQLIDMYAMLYCSQIQKNNPTDDKYWLNQLQTSSYYNWAGYAFEMVCIHHINEIKSALGIEGISSGIYSWQNNEAQIDLIIDRADKVINICEVKFAGEPYLITKQYAQNLKNKISAFKKSTQTRKAIFLTMITNNGLKHGAHNGDIVNEITAAVFF